MLTAKGVDPGRDNGDAVVNAREPETVSEVRSVLGLVSYCSRFIPNFATLSEQLRRLVNTEEPAVSVWPRTESCIPVLEGVSMNLLQKVKSGLGRPDLHGLCHCSTSTLRKIIWMYCPGHAGVKGNDRAD